MAGEEFRKRDAADVSLSQDGVIPDIDDRLPQVLRDFISLSCENLSSDQAPASFSPTPFYRVEEMIPEEIRMTALAAPEGDGRESGGGTTAATETQYSAIETWSTSTRTSK